MLGPARTYLRLRKAGRPQPGSPHGAASAGGRWAARVASVLGFLVALGFIVWGRMALAYRSWQEPLFRYPPLTDFVGGAFTGITHPGNALPFYLAAMGCLLLGLVLPRPGARVLHRDEVAPQPVARNARRGALAAAASSCAAAAASAWLLREPTPGSASVALWLGAVILGGGAVLVADRSRRTPIGNPLPSRREWLVVLLLFAADLLLIGHDVGHWRWTGTPDEANFFPFARDIALGHSEHFVLSETGMYDVHPLLSSHYQAWFMRLFGINVVGWKLSSAFAVAISLPFVYVLGRELWSRRFGLVAAILFGATPLAVGFGHFGYNNAQIFFFITASLAMLAWAMRRRSLLAYWLAGTITGLSVFTFYPARMSAPLLLVLAFAAREAPWRRARRVEWAVLVAAAVIAATPCLVHPEATLGRMFGQTAFHAAAADKGQSQETSWSDALATVSGKSARVARHWGVAMLHPLWFPSPSHFQASSVVDPLQAALAVAGLVLAWRGMRRNAGARFLAIAYPFSALAVGAVSQHDCPPLTRLVFLCPFTSMLAALSIQQVGVVARRLLPRWGRASGVVTAILVALSVLWGTEILRYSVYVRWHGYGEGTTSELVRLMRALPVDWRIVYVQRVPTYMASTDAVLSQYGWHQRFDYLRISPEILKHMPNDSARNLLIADDLPPGAERDAFEAAMSERFPEREWRETAPGKSWNLRVLAVGRHGTGGWEPPPLPERSDLGQILFGFLDW